MGAKRCIPERSIETAESDGDGVGDNADAFRDDANETAIRWGWCGDGGDAFPDAQMRQRNQMAMVSVITPMLSRTTDVNRRLRW